jgi:hypothetical protein
LQKMEVVLQWKWMFLAPGRIPCAQGPIPLVAVLSSVVDTRGIDLAKVIYSFDRRAQRGFVLFGESFASENGE